MVALNAKDAERILAALPDTFRLFLVYGNDAGGVSERAQLIEKAALARGGGDTVRRFGSDEISADPGRIADEAYSASLFGGEPVISLRVLDGRHNVVGALQPLIDRPPDSSWLIVEAGELAPSSPLRKAFEASPRAAAVPTFQVEGGGLASLVQAAAEAAGLIIEPPALEVLAGRLGGDRLASRREIEKLFLYVGDAGRVTPADVEAVVGDTAEARSEEIVDAAALGDGESIEAGLGRLRAEGGSAAALGAQLLRHLFQLAGWSAQIRAGSSIAAVLDRARPPVFSRRRRAVEAQLQRWSYEDLAEARRLIAEAVLLTRQQPSLEFAAISAALHAVAGQARRPRRPT